MSKIAVYLWILGLVFGAISASSCEQERPSEKLDRTLVKAWFAIARQYDGSRITQFLLQHRDQAPRLINAADGIGDTAAHHAAVSGNIETLTWLFAWGADLLQQNDEGKAPLHAALEASQTIEVLQILLAYGIGTKPKQRKNIIKIAMTAILWTDSADMREALKWLLCLLSPDEIKAVPPPKEKRAIDKILESARRTPSQDSDLEEARAQLQQLKASIPARPESPPHAPPPQAPSNRWLPRFCIIS